VALPDQFGPEGNRRLQDFDEAFRCLYEAYIQFNRSAKGFDLSSAIRYKESPQCVSHIPDDFF